MSKYRAIERGSRHTFDYRVFIYDEKIQSPISPFHDVPLFADETKNTLNMIVEIPRWTCAKLEMSTKDMLNPIKQDIKKGNLRYVANVFPHHGYMWNYGAFPQTWENPELVDEHTNEKGDNDPLDVVEIGSKVCHVGEIVRVKVLGCLALIDEGETDWKVIVINVNDADASKLNNIEDIRKHKPMLLEETQRWFKVYKMPAGSGPNKFAFEGVYFKGPEFASKVIAGAHKEWNKLVNAECKSDIFIKSMTLGVEGGKIPLSDANDFINSFPVKSEETQIPAEARNLHYVH